jgi:hypothetical protein
MGGSERVEIMKRTLFLLTLLNVVMMIAAITSVFADDRVAVAAAQPASLLLIMASLLGFIGISMIKKR